MIRRRDYVTGVAAAERLGACCCHPDPERLAREVIDTFLGVIGIEVEKDPADRLKDFFAAYHEWVRDIATDLHELQHLVIQHFPELAQHD